MHSGLLLAMRLPAWAAEWLGVEIPAAGDAANWHLESSWRWPPWATVLLVVAAILWTVAIYSRESSAAGRRYRVLLATLRMAAIAILLVMLAQWALAVRLTGPPTLVLAVDRSASMAIADMPTGDGQATKISERLSEAGLTEASRLNIAKAIAIQRNGHLISELAHRYHLKVYFVDGKIERQPRTDDMKQVVDSIRNLTANGPESSATRLGDFVHRVLEESRGALPAAIVLLTDGVTTEGLSLGDAAREAQLHGVPIYSIGIGDTNPPRDIELADVLVDDSVFVDDLVSFQIEVKASGLGNQPAEVVLRRQEESTPLAKETIALPSAGENLSLQLVDRPKEPGDVNYIVEITPRSDETNSENNRQRRVVAVRDAKIRVLLVSGYPSYEFRFLKTLLERDSTVQLATYLQDADPEYTEQDKTALRTLPGGREELFEYDVVAVSDVDPRVVPPSFWQSVRAFAAEKGGGVIFMGGPRFLPWLYRDNSDVRALLPIEMDSLSAALDARLPTTVTRGFVVQPTPLGLRNPAMQLGDSLPQTEEIWRDLAPLHWLVEAGELKPAAQTLAVGPSISGASSAPMPVFVFQYFGAGRVLYHAVDATWRWRIGVGDIYFGRYWVQTIRHLARGKLNSGSGAELATDRREYRRREPVQLRLRIRDLRLGAASSPEATVIIEAPGQERRRLSLHRNPVAPGVFEGTIADLNGGNYEVLLIEPSLPGNPPSTTFTVVAPPGEMARTQMDRRALGNLAETTHGKFYTASDSERLLDELPTGRRVPTENLPPIPLWNRWWLLSAFLACITGEWILRKRKGML